MQRRHARGLRLLALAMSTLGVVYGDIGELWAQAQAQAALPRLSDGSTARGQLAHCLRCATPCCAMRWHCCGSRSPAV